VIAIEADIDTVAAYQSALAVVSVD